MKALAILSIFLLAFTTGCSSFSKKCHGKKQCSYKAKKKARFTAMDKNGDGKVSRKEFRDGKNSKFNEWDADKDGYLTWDEKMAAVHSRYGAKCKNKKSCSKSKHKCSKKECSGGQCPLKKKKE